MSLKEELRREKAQNSLLHTQITNTNKEISILNDKLGSQEETINMLSSRLTVMEKLLKSNQTITNPLARNLETENPTTLKEKYQLPSYRKVVIEIENMLYKKK